MMSKSSNRSANPLSQWLDLTWERPERSYNPDLRDFLVGLLDYPRTKVVTEDTGPAGYPDLKIFSPEGIAWVVGDMKKDDKALTVEAQRQALWEEKRKYVDGLTRFVLFVTPHFLWVISPSGETLPSLEAPLDLRLLDWDTLRARLAFLTYESSQHTRQWTEFTTGTFPFSYLHLTDADTLNHLRADLRAGFTELTQAATRSLAQMQEAYNDYVRRSLDIERNLVGQRDTQRRARVRLDQEFSFVRRVFAEALPQFEEQYGREVNGRTAERDQRVQEAFLADSVAALMARVLFLRLVEDLELTQKRRLSNGGPHNWTAFVEYLTGDARALVRIASEDVARVYQEPFAHTVFDWIHYSNGDLDEALQRYLLRLNAYDFAGLSEEILGDIYQQFLPVQKRKQLGEYYTPTTIVDWILEHTVQAHGIGNVLDPSCGSGSFLVRYAHWRLADAARRNLDRALVRQEVQEEVWGFDLNPFAAFVSLFQVTWALLRFLPQAAPPQVHVYNLNSILKDGDIAIYLGEEHLAPGSKVRDENRWRYVLGNPPYIRAERVKYAGEMQELWRHVWGQNSDTGLLFLYRSLTEWLEPGGFLGMVVSGGYANSEAAAKVWKLLPPGGNVALRKIVWLEFVGRVWDASVIPLILIIERVEAKPDDEVELYVPSSWPSDAAPVKVRYADFFDKKISPNVSNPLSQWGDYLLPLLQPEDVPILRKLFPDQITMGRLGDVVPWTYGIQRGGVELTAQPSGTRPVQVIAGRSLAMAWPGEPAGWVDLEAVEKRPNGKLSLWRGSQPPRKFIAVATLGKMPSAAVVESETVASINTTIISRDATEISVSLEAVAAFLNSKLASYYWAIKLRTAVLEGSSRATFYPRTLESLPWPKSLSPEREQELADGYDRLAKLAVRAKNNPNEWLLAEAAQRITQASLRLTDPVLDLKFPQSAAEAPLSELTRQGAVLQNNLLPFAEFADPVLAEYVLRLLQLTGDEETAIGTATIQKLLVPRDYAALMDEYRRRWEAFGRVEEDFFAALAQVDNSVYALFDVTDAERMQIEARLGAFPLNRLKPRFPWDVVRPRTIKAYTQDRFA